tara:strand:- start:393 stop:557 length:165 start_codon:yes stop_codon:yes gene_type:complete
MLKKVKFMDVLKYIWKGIFKSEKPKSSCTFDECRCKLDKVRKQIEAIPLNNKNA